MQYIFTEDEYNELTSKLANKSNIDTEVLQDLCTMVANYKPVRKHWDLNSKFNGPWGCILNAKNGSNTNNPETCDMCPVKIHCPHPYKEYSR